VLVVGTWTYFTDFTFLYIVYILAFVGAVIMLFLSVILMLPSSITSSNIRHISLPLGSVITELSADVDNGNIVYLIVVFIIINFFL